MNLTAYPATCLTAAFCLWLVPLARAGSVTLAWSPSPTPGVTYVLYGTTNTTLVEANLATAQLIVDAGTNLTVTAYTQPAAIGAWKFTVTARLGGVQSAPSNLLTVTVPAEPPGLTTLVLQYSGTLEGIGSGPTNLFIRVKAGLP